MYKGQSIDHSLISPSGRMSKRARKAAIEREAKTLFAGIDLNPPIPQPTEAERLRRWAAELRALAEQGMKPSAYAKKAAALEAQAEQLQNNCA